jgi:hypothetical protein
LGPKNLSSKAALFEHWTLGYLNVLGKDEFLQQEDAFEISI